MTVVQFNEISRMIRKYFLPANENFTIMKPYTKWELGT